MAYQPNHATPQQPPIDPFDDFEKVPSLSWAEAPVGTVYKGTISKLPREVHDRDIATKEPKFWKSGEPQMSVVMHLDITTVQGTVETRSVWAKKPSSMYRALGQAQKDAGAKFALGGTVYIRLDRLEPSKTPGFNAQKIYMAKYEPPVTADPWDNTAKPAQPAAPQSAPQPDVLCQHAALPQGPRPPQPSGLCGNMAVAVLAGHRICQMHKAQVKAVTTQAAASAQSQPVVLPAQGGWGTPATPPVQTPPQPAAARKGWN